MKLTYEQKKQIYDHGYVRIPGVIPKVMIDEALRAINHSMGEGMNKEDMLTFRSQSYTPELQSSEMITSLFNHTPAFDLVQSALGEGNFDAVKAGQIALRFPGWQDPPNPPRAHIDGTYTPHNGVPQGTIQNFTLLAGVLLSDVKQSYSGNFTVWPGTHHLFESYFKENGIETLIDGMPQVKQMPDPVQLTGHAGDLILAHYQLAHAAAINVSPHIRYAIFFRLSHHGLKQDKVGALTNIWRDWPGIKEIIS